MEAILFDLDSCLAPAGEVGAQLYAPVFEAILQVHDGSVPADRLASAFDDTWRFPFDEVADRHGFTPAMRQAGFNAWAQVAVTQPMHGYGDLDVLAALEQRLFLVTSGFRRLQESKVAALGIAHLFEAVVVDAIDEPGRRGKAGIFAGLLETHGLRPATTLVVGDNPDSEIAAGNRLGMTTVQTLRPGVAASPLARHAIASLRQLPALLRSLAGSDEGERA